MSLDALNNITGREDVGPNVDDVSNFMVQDLSPEQQQAFDAQSSIPAATPRIGFMDYFPGANQPINVGNYSGSVIGSTSLFAPSAGLVPFSQFDARERAIQEAALMKAKEVDAFRKSFKAPTSKLVNINEELSNQYVSFLDSSWKNALRKAGGDGKKAMVMLQSDPNFSSKEKAYQDMAKYGDAIVSKIAQDDEDIKTGRFTPTPEYKALKQKMLTALDPNSPNFKDLGNTFRQMKVERDFADAFNEVTKKMVAEQTGYAGDTNSDEFIKVYEGTTKQWSEAQKKAVIDQMKNFYQGSDYFSNDKIEKDVRAMMTGKWEEKKLDVKERREASDGSGYNYTENDISQEPSSTNVFVSTGQGKPSKQGEIVGNYGVTHKKPIPAVIPTGRNFYINDEKNGLIKTSEVSPNSEIKLFKTELVKVYDGPAKEHQGTPLSEQQVKSGQKFKWEAMTKGVMVDAEGNEKSFFIPTKEVENSIVKNRDKSGKVTQGIPVDKLYKEAERLNSSSQNKQSQQPAATRKTISASEIASRAKAAGYTAEEYTKLLKQKGIEIK